MDPIAVTCENRPGVPQALTVTQLTRVIRDTIRANPILSRILVRGEVSNLQRAPSGHVFFTLKDATAQLSCTLFREDAEMLGFDLEDGMDVVVSGDVDVFPRRGSVQLLIKAATPAGVGAFWAAYQKTRKKLAAEGLFDAARKRPLPAYPRKIGVGRFRAASNRPSAASFLRVFWYAAQNAPTPAGVAALMSSCTEPRRGNTSTSPETTTSMPSSRSNQHLGVL